ncbi:outer membrane protein assembly factor BamC [Veronia nyctiphanis]|uniref:Outer membrane protein assembly factor BamC n=1 Tax=Veronia nyctiphanis TaxID=1278244 RepID=A0A4Q0YL30_9GAMM|nr:outer membrane protein assembly factor BamC [Veronia nyctiphanis]RXJ71450.1 outer membrane protein assembly factor BamC [Veronia nyctiphanis]
MKPIFKLSASVVILSLAGCAGGVADKHQAKDDFSYLETPPLIDLTALPNQQSAAPSAFKVPSGNFPGEFGAGVDIRPPLQVLGTIPGARIVNDRRGVTLWVDTDKKSDRLWRTATELAANEQFTVRSQNSEEIETDWVKWPNGGASEARYMISKLSSNKRYGLRLDVIEWQNSDKGAPNQSVRQSFNARMANLITEGYDASVRAEARERAVALNKNIPITLGKDRGGLPVIIARAPYDIVWERLPGILELIGFEVEYRNRSQGTINAEFEAQTSSFGRTLATANLNLNAVNTYCCWVTSVTEHLSMSLILKVNRSVNRHYQIWCLCSRRV